MSCEAGVAPFTWMAVLLMLACSDPNEPLVAGPSGLGMNDVTMLLPLPADPVASTTLLRISDAGELVSRELFTRLVTTPGDVLGMPSYEEFHVVAVRFDLCDRAAPGVCPVGEDGRLRLVLQPLHATSDGGRADDVALHAFYPIPNADLAGVVDDLRALAALGGTPSNAPLRVSTAIAAPEYAERLRTMVTTYAKQGELFRLTLFAKNGLTHVFAWLLRGVVREDAGFADIQIPSIDAVGQGTILTGDIEASYETEPVADSPSGFTTAIEHATFEAASQTGRLAALEALAQIQNPTMTTAETTQCVACHVATFLTERRAAFASVDPATLTNRFTSSYDLSTAAGISTSEGRSLRGLGWLVTQPAISQRVVNDTAQVLAEIENRFPE